MKSRLLLSFVLLLSLSGCFARRPVLETGPDLVFETLLMQFKYSLYPLLESEEMPERLPEAAEARIHAFVAQYPTELKRYRELRLSRFGRYRVDLTLFEEVPLDSDLRHSLNRQQDVLMPAVQLLDPLGQMQSLIPHVLMQEMAARDLGAFYARAAVATPLLQATPGPAGEWEILADYHSRAFRFVCQIETGKVELRNYYRRRGEPVPEVDY